MCEAEVKERFWARVDKTETCWNWTLGFGGGGYGYFTIDGHSRMAARICYELLTHTCLCTNVKLHRTCLSTKCINPDHMVLLTKSKDRRRRR